MSEHKIRTFDALSSFVQDLDTEFGKKYKPVALYNRLIQKTVLTDTAAIEKHISAFNKFFEANPNYIQKKALDGGRIKYSDRVYLNIIEILSKTSKETHSHIHQHLFIIYSLLNAGTCKGKEALEALKKDKESENDIGINIPDTAEGNFIKGALTEMTQQFEGFDENTNPMLIMTGMMQSGFFTKFMGDIQNKFASGEMDIKSLMGTVTSVVTNIAPQGTDEASEIRNFVSQSTSQLSSMMGGQEMPEEIKEMLNPIMKGPTIEEQE